MTLSGHSPPWHQFKVIKHPPQDAHFCGIYCLAAAARWFHRFDYPKKPTIPGILQAMRAAIPADVPATGLIEKQLRMAGDAYDLHLFRPGVGSIMDLGWQPERIWLAAVRGLLVPRLREPPSDRRYVLVLGLPDDQARFQIAAPHPGTPAMYKVPIEKFGPAWDAGATKTHKPWAVVITSMW